MSHDDFYSKEENVFITSVIESAIDRGYKVTVKNDDGFVNGLEVDDKSKVNEALEHMGFSDVDKILIFDETGQTHAVFSFAGIGDRDGSSEGLIVNVEAEPNFNDLVDLIIGDAEEKTDEFNAKENSNTPSSSI